MKTIIRFFLFLFCIQLGVSADSRIKTLVLVTNVPSLNDTITVNGDARTWTTNTTLLAGQLRIGATASVSATNLYNAIIANGITGNFTLVQTNGGVYFVAAPNATVTFSKTGSWGSISSITNVSNVGTPATLPFSTSGLGGIQQATLIIDGINSYATNKLNSSVLDVISGGGSGNGSVTNIAAALPIVSTTSDGITFNLSFLGSSPFNASGATNLSATELRVGTVPYARLGAEIVTNISSSSLTVTGLGTRTINIEAPVSGDVYTTSNNAFAAGLTNTFNGETVTSNLTVYGSFALPSILHVTHVRDTNDFDYFDQSRAYFDTVGRERMDVNNMAFYDENFRTTFTGTAANRALWNSSNQRTVNWEARTFPLSWTASAGFSVTGPLNVTGAITNTGNFVTTGTLNDMTVANFVTNISSSGLTVTSQGTHTINIEPIVSPLNVTNITSSTLTVTQQGTKVINIESGASSVSTTAPNTFTVASTNTFNAITTTSNLVVNGFLLVNTNLSTSSGRTIVVEPNSGASQNWIALNTSVNGVTPVDTAGVLMGDYKGTGANLELDVTGNNGRITLGGGSSPSWTMSVGGANYYSQTAALLSLGVNNQGITLGGNSGSTLTINGATAAIPNGLNIGSGIFNLPTLSTTIITNSGAGLFTSGSLTAGTGVTAPSITTTTTDGMSYVDSGTNNTLNLIANGGSGVIITKARMTIATASPSGGSAVNTIYTNGNQRTFVSVSGLFPAGSGAYVWSCNGTGGSTTNTDDIKVITALTTNNVSSIIQPNDFYMISNFIGTAPTVIKWNEKRL